MLTKTKLNRLLHWSVDASEKSRGEVAIIRLVVQAIGVSYLANSNMEHPVQSVVDNDYHCVSRQRKPLDLH
ncbi:hypothetical protein CXB77_07330 [Chromatium okenii]|jgi:hypothetical protein|uniref:Uncharacterized protein n=1 Tax=Chromatium okenii TaxID=61644 RepID=A0A2S7XS88_9GAMM|nr:hypothetical protein CXB77_07330 [Chromatium okenii]